MSLTDSARLAHCGTSILALLLVGCAQGPGRAELATAVARNYLFECPAEGIRVVEARDFGVDRVYIVDACGVVVELEHGMPLPETSAEMPEMSEEEIVTVAESFEKSVPMDVMRLMRIKVTDLCALGPPSSRDLSSSRAPARIYTNNPEELARCEQELAASLAPLGADREERTRRIRYWFRAGQFVFYSSPSFYKPPCDHLILENTPEQCQCRKVGGAPDPCQREMRARKQELQDSRLRSGESVAVRAGTDSPRRPEGYFWGFEVGFGFLSVERDNEEHYSGPSLQLATRVGGSLIPGLMLGVSAGLQSGLESERLEGYGCTESNPGFVVVPVEGVVQGSLSCGNASTELHNMLGSLSVFSSVYPFPDLGLHSDLWFGGGLLSTVERVYPFDLQSSAGITFGGGVGYDLRLGEEFRGGVSVRVDRMMDGSEGYDSWAYGFAAGGTWQ